MTGKIDEGRTLTSGLQPPASGRHRPEASSLRVVNLTRGVTLAERAEVADTFLRRLRGLLGRRGFGPDDGLWIEPCAGVHGLGMAFAVDVILVDEGLTALWARTLRPWRIGGFHLEARAALELPAGTLERTGTRPGDRLELRATSES